MLRFGFDDLKLTRIQGRCTPENISSERVLQKAGLKFDRMMAGREGFSEDKLYVMSREDFLTATPFGHESG